MAVTIMKIKDHFIDSIINGTKKHEYRLANDERKNLNINDKIILVSNQDANKYVKVVVLSIIIFDSWEEVISENWIDDFSKYYSTKEQAIRECQRFYSQSEIEQYGIISFGVTPYKKEVKGARVLLDTNIIIQRESLTDVSFTVAQLNKWLDKINVTKIIHPSTILELGNYQDIRIKENILKKIESYEKLIPNNKKDAFFVNAMSNYSLNENSQIDNELLLQVYNGFVDYLITDDKTLLNKAGKLFLRDCVFSSIEFLDMLQKFYPSMIDYNVLSVNKKKFGEIDINDIFFDSLREDYEGIKFNNWFIRKNTEEAYVFEDESGIQGFLYLKVEFEDESYKDINPTFEKKKRLKVGTFKVNRTGLRLGERFIKIIIDNAIRHNVEEIYVTLFENKREEVKALRELIKKWGFYEYGNKISNNESIYVKDLVKYNDLETPKYNYPLIKKNCQYGFVPIEPQYHTSLFPDLFLKNENMSIYPERACSYALEKIYVTKWKNLTIKPGDLLFIYRNGAITPKKYSSVVTGVVILQEIVCPVSKDKYLSICKNRSVFTEDELEKFYDENTYRTILKLLFLSEFNNKVILDDLRKNKIISADSGPRLNTLINKQQFDIIKMLGESK